MAMLSSFLCLNCGADRPSHDPSFKSSMEDANVPYAGYRTTLLDCSGYAPGLPLEDREPSIEQSI